MKKTFLRVQKGDTLLSIAKKAGVPVTLLIKENALTEQVTEGDLLVVTGGRALLYQIKPQDTTKSVCQRFSLDERTFLQRNGIEYVFYGLTVDISKNEPT